MRISNKSCCFPTSSRTPSKTIVRELRQSSELGKFRAPYEIPTTETRPSTQFSWGPWRKSSIFSVRKVFRVMSQATLTIVEPISFHWGWAGEAFRSFFLFTISANSTPFQQKHALEQKKISSLHFLSVSLLAVRVWMTEVSANWSVLIDLRDRSQFGKVEISRQEGS